MSHRRALSPVEKVTTQANTDVLLVTGDIFSLSMVGMPALVLSTAEAARDLLDKRGANYSDRPKSILHGKL